MKKVVLSAMIMAMMCLTTGVQAQNDNVKKDKKECCEKKQDKKCCKQDAEMKCCKQDKKCCKQDAKAKKKDCKKCTECTAACGDNGCKSCPNNHKCQKNCKK